uniref:Uncharacterized protein n=1 Tax=Bactrocera dorsalis TaxID=27457 RepID=A0A034WS85_BACDO
MSRRRVVTIALVRLRSAEAPRRRERTPEERVRPKAKCTRAEQLHSGRVGRRRSGQLVQWVRRAGRQRSGPKVKSVQLERPEAQRLEAQPLELQLREQRQQLVRRQCHCGFLQQPGC